MAHMQLFVSTDSSNEHVVIELHMDGKAFGHIHLDGATAENHVHDVGKARSRLNDPVTPKLDPGAMLDAIYDPAWCIPKPLAQGRVLALRHPGLGWVSFVLPENSARAISEWLVKELPIQS